MKSTLKGYKLSVNYKKLWELILNGYIIIGFFKEGNNINILQIKQKKEFNKTYIGSRAMVYFDEIDATYKEFYYTCKIFNIKFIPIPSFYHSNSLSINTEIWSKSILINEAHKTPLSSSQYSF